ncbi:hypothetical protein [uncultured Helicobacter sp.]|uniref:hypothetical protein n=1 Tax=uncultured Helicobacter sp. TaxID=175537 RepID=UPI00374F7811
MKHLWLFYLGLATCVLGYVFIGLGVVLFPISIFCLMYAGVYHLGFWIMMVGNILGFSISLFVDIKVLAGMFV